MPTVQLQAVIAAIILAGDWANPQTTKDDNHIDTVAATQLAGDILRNCGIEVYES